MKNIVTKMMLGVIAILFTFISVPSGAEAASWEKNNTGWWWQEDDGSYPRDEWKTIGGKKYYFDKNL